MSETKAPYAAITGFEIGGEQQTIIAEKGGVYEVKKSPWIKLSAEFREEALKKLQGSPLSVFLCIALHINENGEAWPSYITIMKETGFTNRNTIGNALNFLCDEIGLVERISRPGKSTKYRIKAFAAYGKKTPVSQNDTGQNEGGVSVNDTTPVSLSDTRSRTKEVEPKTLADEPQTPTIPKAHLALLRADFSRLTHVQEPDWNALSPKTRRETGAAWNAPLKAFWELCGMDVERTRRALAATIAKADYTIYTPRSLRNTFQPDAPAVSHGGRAD